MVIKSLDSLPVLDKTKMSGSARLDVAELAMITKWVCSDHTQANLVGVVGTNGKTGSGELPSVVYVGDPYKDKTGLHVHLSDIREIRVREIESYEVLAISDSRSLSRG